MPPRGKSDPGFGSGGPRYPGTFLLAFREAARQLGWQVRQITGHLAECRDAEQEERAVGLENLFRRLRRADRSNWPALIVEFLRSAASIEVDELSSTNLNEVSERLLARIGPRMEGAGAEARVWHQPLGETGLFVNLVIDFEQGMAYVTEQMVEESGRPGAEWLNVALANLHDRTPPDCFHMIDEDIGLRACLIHDAYDSSRALILDELLPEAQWGCFVAVPGRDHLLILPVTADSLGTVHLLKFLAQKDYQNTPYAISDQVYWVHDKDWHHFGIELEQDKATVQPPPAFVEILPELLPEGKLDLLDDTDDSKPTDEPN
ncbi:MAG: hypothetical protein ACK4RK_08585 [Gemmataceae bacterium]